MLKLSVEKPLKENNGHGWARYRIDFENLEDDYYVLGWVSSRFPAEAREFLYNIKGWKEGVIKEIYQENVYEVRPFKVRLYRAGLIQEGEEPDVFLIEEKTFGSQQPLE